MPLFHRAPPKLLSFTHNLYIGLLLAMLTSLTGCSTWSQRTGDADSNRWNPTQWFKKEYQEPASLAAIWSPDSATTAGQPTMRGFGGRIYFYNQKSQAVPVEGDLIIHGYLTTPGRPEPTSVNSDKRFVFSSEQLVTHFSPSQIGASYSIWVPWDEEGGFREEITLIPTFKSKKGNVVQGTPAKLFLPGKSRIENQTAGNAATARTVSYTTEAVPTHPGPEALNPPATRTTTIEIPDTTPLSRMSRAVAIPNAATVPNAAIVPHPAATTNTTPVSNPAMGTLPSLPAAAALPSVPTASSPAANAFPQWNSTPNNRW